MTKIKINIYVVEDARDSINRFEQFAQNLGWIQKIAELGVENLKEAIRLAKSFPRISKPLKDIMTATGLEEEELKNLSTFLSQNNTGNWSEILDEVSRIELNVSSFHIESDKYVYIDALRQIQQCQGTCFWLVDVIWEQSFKIDEILEYLAKPIKDVYNKLGYHSNTLGAYNIAYHVLLKNKKEHEKAGEFYVVSSTTGSKLTPMFNIPNIKLSTYHKKYFISDTDSISTEGSPSIIIRILTKFWYNYLSKPITKLRFFAHFDNDGSWFKEDYKTSSNPAKILVPHEFPDYDNQKRFVTASECLLNAIKLPIDRYDFFTHNGLKSICLSGNELGGHTLYTIAIIADAQREQDDKGVLTLNPDNFSPEFIKTLNSACNTEKIDFAETLYSFFTSFLHNSKITLTCKKNFIGLTSDRPVVGNSDTLFTRVCDHLAFYKKHNQWKDPHLTSKPLAQCIEYGGWGLYAEKVEFRKQTGSLRVTVKNREIVFSW